MKRELTDFEKAHRNRAVKIYRMQQAKNAPKKDADIEYREIEFQRRFAEAIGHSGMLPPVVDGKISAYNEEFIPLGAGVAVLYDCAVCNEQHSHPIKDMASFGKFLEERSEIEQTCKKPDLPPEQKTVQLLQSILAELKRMNGKGK